MIRVIGGRFKRRRLDSVPGEALTRPTADRVKESLFNILQGEIEGAQVLDLFSGTGALGIEALSRGAASCCFVERDKAAAAVLASNLARLGLGPVEARLIVAPVDDVLRAPDRFGLVGRTFDLVLADPPYKSGWTAGALATLGQSPLLSKICTVVFEMPSYDDLVPASLPDTVFLKRMQREYGKTRLEIWQRADGADGAVDHDERDDGGVRDLGIPAHTPSRRR